jgi:hypothetical protein
VWRGPRIRLAALSSTAWPRAPPAGIGWGHPKRTRRNHGPPVRTLPLPRRSAGCSGDIRLALAPPGVASATWITPDIAARRTCGPRLVRGRPAAPRRVAPLDARRRRGREAVVVAGASRCRSTPTSPGPEGARGAGGASTSGRVIRAVRISCGGACHARDRRGSQPLVDAGPAGCASRVRLPGVRSSAAGGRYHRGCSGGRGPGAMCQLISRPFEAASGGCSPACRR